MPHFDAETASCAVFTYKEGLLSAVAHDLKLRVERFDVDVDPTQVHATFDAASLRVQCAMKDGKEAQAMAAKDAAEIEATIAKEVLVAAQHPSVEFRSSAVRAVDDGFQIDGTLTVRGTSKSVTIPARRTGDELVATIRLNQPDFGIKPYTAMLGTLKIKPEIAIELHLPATWL